jgi:threonine/homoserine/homoserine lactone efflux protein
MLAERYEWLDHFLSRQWFESTATVGAIIKIALICMCLSVFGLGFLMYQLAWSHGVVVEPGIAK